MKRQPPIPRRTFLRGLGAAVALPVLDGLLPRRALGDPPPDFPPRMAFIYVPNGAHMPDWTPRQEGPDFELPPTLEALAPFRRSLLVLTGLTQDKARPNGDGPGDHARAAAAFLTGAQPFKTAGANIKVGVSVDQVAASRIGSATRFPSLELGCDPGMQSGNCDSGYSCAYSSSISWKTESMPMAKETNPRLLFERLFGADDPSEEAAGRDRMARRRKSVLDLVRDDASSLQARLGSTDRRKLDEYLTSVREIERRLEGTQGGAEARPGKDPGLQKPDGVPRGHGDHVRLMMDLLVLAFRTDATRIATFLVANEGSNRSYPEVEVREGHHDLSHHGNEKEKQEKIARINRLHVSHLAYFLERLESVEEGGRRLLDHCMVLYGSGIGDGNRHNHDELPILLAGGGCGTLDSGRHLRYPRNTPLNNLFLSMLDRMSVPTESLGDGTGRLEGLGSAA